MKVAAEQRLLLAHDSASRADGLAGEDGHVGRQICAVVGD